MNWYKITKLAMPFSDRPAQGSYLSVGHHPTGNPGKGVFIWLIDKNGQFHMKEAVGDEEVRHGNWDLYHNNVDDFLAQGRYVKDDNQVSLSTNIPPDMSSQRIEFLRRKIEKILDSNLGNPTILDFN